MLKMPELGGENSLFKRILLELKSLVAWWFLLSCRNSIMGEKLYPVI
jgi:hypothetical protein